MSFIKKLVTLFVVFAGITSCAIADDEVVKSTYLPNEQHWWLGITSLGEKMPLQSDFSADTTNNNYGNQAQPLALSEKGYFVWSEEPFAVEYKNGQLVLRNYKKLHVQKPGNTLREAYRYASTHYFPASGKMPHELLISAPQYNTWIELTYNQNQQDILNYARSIVKNGFPAGVLMIDDTWQEGYGTWRFHPGRFPDPKKMMKELHAMGFKVMLWVVPFVSGDSVAYRSLEAAEGLLREDSTEHLPVMVPWWNGRSAVLDLSNPVDKEWFQGELDYLQSEYEVDGFKLDAGDSEYYVEGKSFGDISANRQTELFARVGLNYTLNEYRATWKMGGQPLVQRLRDKNHSWVDLQKLVPQMNLMGIMGYPFSCPDMIGGGQFKTFLEGNKIDQALVVRSAQAHALMPMMQFSVAPWRVLDAENLKIVKSAVTIRERFKDYILAEARKSAVSGEPIMRMMEYNYPHQGYVDIKDQFLIGERLLVAPILKENAKQRKVFLPKGQWESANGEIVSGPKVLLLPVTLGDLPYYQLKD